MNKILKYIFNGRNKILKYIFNGCYNPSIIQHEINKTDNITQTLNKQIKEKMRNRNIMYEYNKEKRKNEE